MKPSLELHSGILGHDRQASPSAFAIPNPKCPVEILPRGMDLAAVEEICNATLLQKEANFWDVAPHRRRRPQESGRGLEWNVRLKNLGRRFSGGGSEEAGSRSQRHILQTANLQQCCQHNGLDRMMCFEFLRRAKMDEVCQEPIPHIDVIVFGIRQPCCRYTEEERYTCFDQVRYGYQRLAHAADYTEELVNYYDKWEAFNALKNTQLQRPHRFTPPEVRHLCWRDRHWMVPEEPVGAARCAPFRNRTDSESVALKKEMIGCCEDMESGRMACLDALRRKRCLQPIASRIMIMNSLYNCGMQKIRSNEHLAPMPYDGQPPSLPLITIVSTQFNFGLEEEEAAEETEEKEDEAEEEAAAEEEEEEETEEKQEAEEESAEPEEEEESKEEESKDESKEEDKVDGAEEEQKDEDKKDEAEDEKTKDETKEDVKKEDKKKEEVKETKEDAHEDEKTKDETKEECEKGR
uniref:Uncharacterized protein n=1 Tax=Branchiostoma floridae TaxID=7739 RepID=C3YS49_BRAFL|eukprot:XP_002600942.1 hypothetical protein BRAFLDRAFT_79132 [Branchiostoma floridae]